MQADVIEKIETALQTFYSELGDDFVQNITRNIDAYRNRKDQSATNLHATSAENLKIAVVGAFSCGKSTFINSILDDEVAPVEITPKTHGVTSFLFCKTERYDADGKSISRKEYQEQVQDCNNQVKHFIVYYPCEKLQNLEFMDSPGFGSVSGQNEIVAKKDTLLSEEAVNLADVVFFLSNITEGVIQGDALARLEKICQNKSDSTNPHRKIFVILTWADKKAPSEREQIQESIKTLCAEHQLFVDGIILYSSKSLESFRSASTREYFASTRENLFKLLIQLRNFRLELMEYRQLLQKHATSSAVQQIVQNFLYGARDIAALSEPLLIKDRERELEKKWSQFREAATQAIIDVFEQKRKDFQDELCLHCRTGFMDMDDVVEYHCDSQFVCLEEDEVRDICKKITDEAKKRDFDLSQLKKGKLKKFFCCKPMEDSDWEDPLHQAVGILGTYYPPGSIGDQYSRICVEMITSLGGPWNYGKWKTSDEMDVILEDKREDLSTLLDANAINNFIELIDANLKSAVFESQMANIREEVCNRIEQLRSVISEIQVQSGCESSPDSPVMMKSSSKSKKKKSASKNDATDFLDELF